MKFAFSTSSCPQWDSATIAARVKEYGYDGLEIGASAGDAGQIAAACAAQGVQVAALDTEVRWQGSKDHDQAAQDQLRKIIDVAAAAKCSLVKIADPPVPKGRGRMDLLPAFVAWLQVPAAHASERGLTLLIKNTAPLRTCGEIWTILEMFEDPALGAAWDLCNGFLAGETPSIAVPTLNQRLRYVQVCDAQVVDGAAHCCPLGEGALPWRDLLKRLMGVRHDGWVSVSWDRIRLPRLAEAEVVLPEALRKIHEAIKPPKPMETKKPPPAQPVAVK